MSAESSSKTFLDTNVLVYLFDVDSPRKQSRAREVLTEVSRERRCVVSVQVLSELYVTLTKKLPRPLSPSEAESVIRDIAGLAEVVAVELTTVLASVARARQRSFSYWDALIVEAALGAGCDRLLSEDLQDGRRVETLRIENPFR